MPEEKTALPKVIQSLEDLPESVRPFYERSESTGAYQLRVEGESGDLKSMRVMLDRLKAEAKAAKEKAAALEQTFSGLDPEAARAAIEKLEAAEAKAAQKPDEVESAVKRASQKLLRQLEDERKATQEEIAKRDAKLRELMIDAELRGAAAKASVLPTALEDVLLRGRTIFRLENGDTVVARGADGKELFADEYATQPLTIDVWLSRLSKDAPHLFPQSAGSGLAAVSGQRGAAGRPAKLRSEMTAEEKIEAIDRIRASVGQGASEGEVIRRFLELP